MSAYYNENDPFAAAWLRELINAGQIAPGYVDERSIEDVRPSDLDGFTQCHFFAGIGGWSHALRLAGWPDDRPVWTGSCPCQPFSTAGARKGIADERHLWPSFFHLIEQCRPVTLFGEQVEAAVRQGWLDLVQDDLEGIGYTVGATAFPACSVGAPHTRQRIYFVGTQENLANACGSGLPRREHNSRIFGSSETSQPRCSDGVLGAWRELETDPTTLPSLDGAPVWLARKLVHGYGNAIVPPQTATFIKSFLEISDLSEGDNNV